MLGTRSWKLIVTNISGFYIEIDNYEVVKNEIVRFCRMEIVDVVITIKWFSARKSSLVNIFSAVEFGTLVVGICSLLLGEFVTPLAFLCYLSVIASL